MNKQWYETDDVDKVLNTITKRLYHELTSAIEEAFTEDEVRNNAIESELYKRFPGQSEIIRAWYLDGCADPKYASVNTDYIDDNYLEVSIELTAAVLARFMYLQYGNQFIDMVSSLRDKPRLVAPSPYKWYADMGPMPEYWQGEVVDYVSEDPSDDYNPEA